MCGAPAKAVCSDEAIPPDDPEELQLLLAPATGRRGEDDKNLGLIFGEQGLAIEVYATNFRMHEGLVVFEPSGDFLTSPDRCELRTALHELARELCGIGLFPTPRCRDAQRGNERATLLLLIFREVDGAFHFGMNEPAVDGAALVTPVLVVVTEQRRSERVLTECDADVRHDECGRVGDAVKHTTKPSSNVGEAEHAVRYIVARKPVKMLAFVESHSQGAGEDVEHGR